MAAYMVQRGIFVESRLFLRNVGDITCVRGLRKGTIPFIPRPTTLQYNEELRKGRKIQFDMDGIAAKGFLRSQKPYNPPPDVESKVYSISKSTLGSNDPEMKLDDPKRKFNLLTACGREFGHHVPNSMLYAINTLGDVSLFYRTPVSTTTPYDELQRMELPKNVHVQPDYIRFHPETDTLFGGITAFPRRSTIVTGLRAKKKYQGYAVRASWLN